MRRVVKVSRIRIIITIIVVVLTTLLTGCTGKEPNEIAYVVALGIDSTDDDNYKITIQYANTTQISGGASESGGKAGSEIVDNVTIEAPNIYAGVGLANNIVSKSFSMSHAKLIVFSKEIAEKGVKDMIETLVRSEEIRPDVFIAVANTTANDYLTSVNPEMEVNPAQYYQLIYQKNQLVGIHAVRGGTIVGDHEVIFAGTDEVIELKHSAHSKEVFAVGAIKAAKFMSDKPAGMYSMNDLISTL